MSRQCHHLSIGLFWSFAPCNFLRWCILQEGPFWEEQLLLVLIYFLVCFSSLPPPPLVPDKSLLSFLWPAFSTGGAMPLHIPLLLFLNLLFNSTSSLRTPMFLTHSPVFVHQVVPWNIIEHSLVVEWPRVFWRDTGLHQSEKWIVLLGLLTHFS